MPQNDAIRLAATSDLRSFYERELAIRRELSFPPFSRIIRLVFRAKNATKAGGAARESASQLQALLPGGAEMLGPAECPLSVIAGNHRFQLLVRTFEFSAAHAAVSHYRRSYKAPSGVYVEIDVDPVSLL